MLTKQLRITSAEARAVKGILLRAMAPQLHPKSLRSPNRVRLVRRASSVALSIALLSQALLFGVAAPGAARAQADPEATARVRRLPARVAGAATVHFSSLSNSAPSKSAGGDAGARGGAESRFVEPPPAPPEPTEEEAPVSKLARQGRTLDKSAPSVASADTSGGVSASSVSAPSVATASALPGSSFQAQSDPGFVAPPDASGAVGLLDRVMSTHRSNYVVQDRAGAVLSSVPIEVFWAPTGATTPYNPRALFDPHYQRWLLSAASDPRSPTSSVLVAVSQTIDPQGAYHLYRFDADPDDLLWADFPSLGFNKNWIAITFNAHRLSDNVFAEGRVFALDYPAALFGTPSAALFGGINTTNGGFSMQPAITYSATEEMLPLVSHIGSGAATYRVSTITGTPAAPDFSVGAQKVNGLGGWSQPGGEILPQAPDPSGFGARKIDSSDSRVQKVVFRNGSIYYCQTVGLPAGRAAAAVDRTAVQWTRLDSNANFVEGGRIQDPGATATNGGKWYAYPSLSVNKFGEVLVGFTQFSSTQHPSAAYAVRHEGDAPGTMRGPLVFKEGEGYYEKTLSGTRNLWGLYSNTQVDPVNDRDLWTIQEYAAQPSGVGPNSGRWGTWWSRVVMPNRPPSVAITRLTPAPGGIYVDPATVWITATASDVDGYITSVEFFEGQTKIGEASTQTFGPYYFGWMNVRAGTYSVTARATDNEGGTTTSAPVTVVVHPVTVLSDDFNDNSTDTSKWTVVQAPNTTVTEQNQRLEITTPTSGVGYSGYHARSTLNLMNRRATVEVPQAAYGHGADTYFVLHDKDTENCSFFFAVGGVPGSLLMRETFLSNIKSQVSIPYDPVQHRFWRIRHDPDTDSVRWETSPDGLQWTLRHSAPRRIGLHKLQAQLYAGRFTTTTPSSLAVFDNYRVEDNPPSRVMLADDFNDDSRDPAKWTIDDPSNSVATAREQNQRLEIAPSPSQVGYNGFTSANLYDFTNASAAVEVVQATNPFNPETHLQVAIDDLNNVITVVSGGNIIFQFSVGGGRSRTHIPYDPVAHRFWRIRHDIGDDTVVWETSPDNVNWTVRRTAARPFALNSVRFRLLAGKWTNTNATNPGTAIFDNFKAVREPFEPPTDNFNDNSLDPARWAVYNPGSPSQVSEQNQRLEISLQPNTVVYNGVVSVPTVNFRNKTFTVDVPQTTSQAGWVETFIMIWLDDNNFYQIVTGAGNLVADVMVNGAETRAVIPYNPAQQRFWRIRHNAAAHTMNFEYSGDGRSWTTFRTSPVTFSLDGMKLYLGAGAWGTGNGAPGTAVFDSVKLESNE